MYYNEYSNSERSIETIPFSKVEKVIQAIAFIGLVIGVALIVTSWSELQQIIAIHFDSTGKADGWADKSTLIMLPFLMTVFYIGLSSLERIPQIYNYPVEINEKNVEVQYKNFRTLIIAIKCEVIYLVNYIQWSIIKGALDWEAALDIKVLFLMILFILISIVYFIYRSTKLK